MHRVMRNVAPSRLIVKDTEWKLLVTISPESEHEWNMFSKTQLKKETIRKLEEMYKGCCCYCEAKLGDVSYPEIEYFKPKGITEYKHLCYDYGNLHYCCKKCNLAKSNNYNESMINPSDDEPTRHLIYEKYVAKALDSRGQIMIDTIKLNSRKELEYRRIGYFNQFADLFSASVDCVKKIKERDLTEQEIHFITIFLDRVFSESKHGHSFCSMIKHNFHDGAEMIKRTLIQKGYLLEDAQSE